MVKATESFASWLREWSSNKDENALSQLRSLEASRDRAKQSIKQYELLIAKEENELTRNSRVTYLQFYKDELKAINLKIRVAKKLLTNDDLNTEKADLEYQRLLNHPMITSVIVKDNKLLIATQDLRLEGTDDGDMAEWVGKYIGRFRIRLTLARFEWFMENMDYQTFGQYDRPHVREGKACLGQYDELFKNYEKAGKLYELVDSIIYFLRTAYTSGDSYISMSEWFDNCISISENEVGLYEPEDEPRDDEDWD